MKLLLGWLPDYGGTIRFDGKDAREFTPKQLQQQMSYIEQNVFLFNSTIRDNITLGEMFTDEQMEKALRDSALVGDLASMTAPFSWWMRAPALSTRKMRILWKRAC